MPEYAYNKQQYRIEQQQQQQQHGSGSMFTRKKQRRICCSGHCRHRRHPLSLSHRHRAHRFELMKLFKCMVREFELCTAHRSIKCVSALNSMSMRIESLCVCVVYVCHIICAFWCLLSLFRTNHSVLMPIHFHIHILRTYA